MKVERVNQKTFEPVLITITIENENDLAMLLRMSNVSVNELNRKFLDTNIPKAELNQNILFYTELKDIVKERTQWDI